MLIVERTRQKQNSEAEKNELLFCRRFHCENYEAREGAKKWEKYLTFFSSSGEINFCSKSCYEKWEEQERKKWEGKEKTINLTYQWVLSYKNIDKIISWEIKRYLNLVSLDISNNNLRELPAELGEILPELLIFNVSNNNLEKIEVNFPFLKELFCSRNSNLREIKFLPNSKCSLRLLHCSECNLNLNSLEMMPIKNWIELSLGAEMEKSLKKYLWSGEIFVVNNYKVLLRENEINAFGLFLRWRELIDWKKKGLENEEDALFWIKTGLSPRDLPLVKYLKSLGYERENLKKEIEEKKLNKESKVSWKELVNKWIKDKDDGMISAYFEKIETIKQRTRALSNYRSFIEHSKRREEKGKKLEEKIEESIKRLEWLEKKLISSVEEIEKFINDENKQEKTKKELESRLRLLKNAKEKLKVDNIDLLEINGFLKGLEERLMKAEFGKIWSKVEERGFTPIENINYSATKTEVEPHFLFPPIVYTKKISDSYSFERCISIEKYRSSSVELKKYRTEYWTKVIKLIHSENKEEIRERIEELFNSIERFFFNEINSYFLTYIDEFGYYNENQQVRTRVPSMVLDKVPYWVEAIREDWAQKIKIIVEGIVSKRERLKIMIENLELWILENLQEEKELVSSYFTKEKIIESALILEENNNEDYYTLAQLFPHDHLIC